MKILFFEKVLYCIFFFINSTVLLKKISQYFLTTFNFILFKNFVITVDSSASINKLKTVIFISFQKKPAPNDQIENPTLDKKKTHFPPRAFEVKQWTVYTHTQKRKNKNISAVASPPQREINRSTKITWRSRKLSGKINARRRAVALLFKKLRESKIYVSATRDRESKARVRIYNNSGTDISSSSPYPAPLFS